MYLETSNKKVKRWTPIKSHLSSTHTSWFQDNCLRWETNYVLTWRKGFGRKREVFFLFLFVRASVSGISCIVLRICKKNVYMSTWFSLTTIVKADHMSIMCHFSQNIMTALMIHDLFNEIKKNQITLHHIIVSSNSCVQHSFFCCWAVVRDLFTPPPTSTIITVSTISMKIRDIKK